MGFHNHNTPRFPSSLSCGKTMTPAAVFLAFLCLSAFAVTPSTAMQHERHYKSNTGIFLLDWTVDAENITIKMSGKTNGWVGIMWNNNGRIPHKNVDCIHGAVLSDGSAYVSDGWASGDFDEPDRDPRNSRDVTLLSATEKDGWTSIEFVRPLKTGDTKFDVDVIDKLVFVSWAFHRNSDGNDREMPEHTHTGWTWINFHGPQYPDFGAGTFSVLLAFAGFFLWLVIRWTYLAYKYCYYNSHKDELSVHANALDTSDVEGVASEKKPQVNTSWAPLGPAPLPPFSYALPKTERSSWKNTFYSFAYRKTRKGQTFTIDFVVFGIYVLFNILFVFVIRLPPSQSTAQLGSIAIGNAMLCFVSTTRNSILVYGLGIPFDRAIVFHRWLGNLAVVAGVIHWFWYSWRWLLGGGTDYVTENTLNSVQNELGFFSLVCFVIVFITSRIRFRRNYFEVFYYSHFLVIPGMALAALHHWKCTLYMSIAAVLYGIDRIFRCVWGIHPMKTTKFELLPGGAVCIRFPKHSWRTYHTGQYVWVNFPSLSYLDWHPFTLSSCPDMDECEITVRDLGGYTSELVERAQSGEPVYIRVDGPYGKLSVNYRRYPAVVLVSGGVGVTPMISVLREIYALGDSSVKVESGSASERAVIKGGGRGGARKKATRKSGSSFGETEESSSSDSSEVSEESKSNASSSADVAAKDSGSYESASSSSPADYSSDTVNSKDHAGGAGAGHLVGDAPANPHNKVVYFVWAVPSEEVYGWFAADIEEAMRRSYFPQFPRLVPIIHITKADSVSSPLLKTGRPDVDNVLERLTNDHSDIKRIAVLACGPGPMIESTWLSCIDRTRGDTRFSFHHETFEL